jgi:2-dehydropantoate 2-reductase
MKILLIGSGAIGTFMGGVLSRSGMDVTFFDLPQVIEGLKSRGIRVTGLGEEIRITDVKAVTSVSEGDSFDLAIIAVKGYSTAASVRKIPADAFSQVLTFQNGIGNEEILAEKFSPDRVIAGSITYPVAYPEPGYVNIENLKAGIGLSPMAPGKKIKDLVKIFLDAGLCVSEYDDYRSLKWSKLLLNIICNATCAILGARPGEVFANRGLVRIEREQFLEALQVMREEKINVVDLPGFPVKLMAGIYSYLPPSVMKLIMQGHVARGRGDKKPSLLLELEKSSGETEVSFMNGAIYRHACKFAIPAPVNKILCETLEDVVKGNVDWDEYKGRPEVFINLFRDQ